MSTDPKHLSALAPADPTTPPLPDLDAPAPLVDPEAYARRALAARMGEESAWYLAAWMRPRSLAPGDVLLTHGEPADTLYLLCSGELEVQLPGLTLGSVRAGRWLGEVNLIDRGPASATVVATTRSLLLGLPHETFQQVRADDPGVASDLLRAMLEDLAPRIRRCSAGAVEATEDGGLRVTHPERSVQLLADLSQAVA